VREQRVAEAVREEISDILHNEIKDPRVGFISVTRVEMSGDLRVAKVHFSVLGNESEQAQAYKALKNAAGFIRSELAQRIRLRHAPELLFRLDTSIQQGLKIAKLLNEIQDSADRSKEDGRK